MTEKKQQHKKKRGKVQHIRGSPKKRKIFAAVIAVVLVLAMVVPSILSILL